jgi:hypothetical protein
MFHPQPESNSRNTIPPGESKPSVLTVRAALSSSRPLPSPTRPLNWTLQGATAVQESPPHSLTQERDGQGEREGVGSGSKKMGQALRRLFDNFFSVKEMRVTHLTTISLLPPSQSCSLRGCLGARSCRFMEVS